ncbi:hypothetical protein [Amycolatopsis sp. NPDC051128]|uniref:hypothetical protein n=1 Tax=Amycolatopsis sp. NPDC051128 TaxID=3155412 RepID=UPI0034179764
MDLDGNSWFSSIVSVVTKVAEVASWIPGPIGTVASGVAAVGNAIQGNMGAALRYGAQALAGVLTAGIGTADVGAAIGAYKAVKFARGVSTVLKAARRSQGIVFKGVKATVRQSRVAGRIWVGPLAKKTVTKRGSVRLVSRNGKRQYRSPENKGARGWQSNFESGRVNKKYTNNYHVRH